MSSPSPGLTSPFVRGDTTTDCPVWNPIVMLPKLPSLSSTILTVLDRSLTIGNRELSDRDIL